MANEGGISRSASNASPSSEDLLTPAGSPVTATASSRRCAPGTQEGKPLGKWTIPYLLRHTAYHVLDHTWEMQDRDLTDDASVR
jgi:hypothetical protein